jgi:hypothetical protein
MQILGLLPADIFATLVNEHIQQEDYKYLRLVCKTTKIAMDEALLRIVIHNDSSHVENMWLHASQQMESDFAEFNCQFLTTILGLAPVIQHTNEHTITHRFEQWASGYPNTTSWAMTLSRYPTQTLELRLAHYKHVSERLHDDRLRFYNLRIYAILSFAYSKNIFKSTHHAIAQDKKNVKETIMDSADYNNTRFICMSPSEADTINTTILHRQFNESQILHIGLRATPTDNEGLLRWSTNNYDMNRLKAIAIGATVMLTQSCDISTGAVAGAIGVVTAVTYRNRSTTQEVNNVIIRLNNGSTLCVKRSKTATSSVYTDANGHERWHQISTFPLVLAYAMTGHNLTSLTSDDTIVLILKEPFRNRDLMYLWLSRYEGRSNIQIVHAP